MCVAVLERLPTSGRDTFLSSDSHCQSIKSATRVRLDSLHGDRFSNTSAIGYQFYLPMSLNA